MSENLLYLGLDLSPDYTQLAVYKPGQEEPESIYHSAAKDTYLHPNILFYSTVDGDDSGIDIAPAFSAGSTASSKRFTESGMIIDQLYARTMAGETVDIYDTPYEAKDLLVKMLYLHIKEFTDRFESYEIGKIVVSIADADIRVIRAVRELREFLQLGEDHFELVSHIMSGLTYIFNQPESIRNNSVALFDWDGTRFDYYRIDITRYKSPDVIDVVHKDITSRITATADKDDLDEQFAALCKELLVETYISGVFLTGVGFSEDWLKESADVLCQGRRVFVGQNIYAKGACYRAFGGKHLDALKRYFVKSAHTVSVNVGISLKDEKDTFVPISKGGGEWFSTGGKLYIFLDDTTRVDLIYKSILTGDTRRETIEIHGLPKRPAKTTKLSLETEFYNAVMGAVVIRDEGFGDMYPTTNKIYRKEFDLKWEK